MSAVGNASSSGGPVYGMELANFRRLTQRKTASMAASNVSATLDELCKIVEEAHHKDPTSRLARHMADAVVHALFKDHPDNEHWLRLFVIIAKFSTNLGASGVYDLVNYNGGLHRSEPFHVVWAQSHADTKNLARFQLVVDVALTRFPNSQSLRQSLSAIAHDAFAGEPVIGLDDHDMTAQIFQFQSHPEPEVPTATTKRPSTSGNNSLGPSRVEKTPSPPPQPQPTAVPPPAKENSSAGLPLRHRSSILQSALPVVREETLEHSGEMTKRSDETTEKPSEVATVVQPPQRPENVDQNLNEEEEEEESKAMEIGEDGDEAAPTPATASSFTMHVYNKAMSLFSTTINHHAKDEQTVAGASQESRIAPAAPPSDDQSFVVYSDENAEKTREEVELATQVRYASAAAATMDARAIVSPKSPGGVIVESCKKRSSQASGGDTPSRNRLEAMNSPFRKVSKVTPPTPLSPMNIDCEGGKENTLPPDVHVRTKEDDDEVVVLSHQDQQSVSRRLVGVIDFAALDEMTAEIGRPPIVHSTPFAVGYVPPPLNFVSPTMPVEVSKPVVFAEPALPAIRSRPRKSSTLGRYLMRNLPLDEEDDDDDDGKETVAAAAVAAPTRQAKQPTHHEIQMKLDDLLLLEDDDTQKKVLKTAATGSTSASTSKPPSDSIYLLEDHDDKNRLPTARGDSTLVLEENDAVAAVAAKRTTTAPPPSQNAAAAASSVRRPLAPLHPVADDSAAKFGAQLHQALEEAPCVDDLDTTVANGLEEEEKDAELRLNPWSRELRAKVLGRFVAISLNHHSFDEKLPSIKENGHVELGGERYRCERLIGRGNFAQVYKFVDEAGRAHAAKIEKPECAWEAYICEALRERISCQPNEILSGSGNEEEAKKRALDALMQIDESFVFHDASVLLYPFVATGTLLDVSNAFASSERSELLALYLAIQLINILHVVHAAGVIHADVKPDNLLVLGRWSSTWTADEALSAPGTLRLIDWGRAIDMRTLVELLQSDGLTFVGRAGTQAFDCPHMMDGRRWAYQTDAYCTAATLNVLLFGKYMKVFPSSTLAALPNPSAVRDEHDVLYKSTSVTKRSWSSRQLWADFMTATINHMGAAPPDWANWASKFKNAFRAAYSPDKWATAAGQFNEALDLLASDTADAGKQQQQQRRHR